MAADERMSKTTDESDDVTINVDDANVEDVSKTGNKDAGAEISEACSSVRNGTTIISTEICQINQI